MMNSVGGSFLQQTYAEHDTNVEWMLCLQVCGSKRTEPCTPEQCDGELCSPDAAQSCLLGTKCVGALPTSGKAQRDTEEVEAKLQELRQNITEANEQVGHSLLYIA